MAGGLVVQSGLGRWTKTISLASVNNTLVQAGYGVLYSVYVSNINAAVRYLKLYDKATAPAAGTDVPIATIAIPGATTGGVVSLETPGGANFNLGIGFALTTAAADADTGAVAAGDIVVNLLVGSKS